MNVRIIAATENPVDLCSLCAGVCYGKDNTPSTRVSNCVSRGHTSILEHASITFEITGVSRALMGQLTRHRHTSFNIESQRYNRYEMSDDDDATTNRFDWMVVPESLYETDDRWEIAKSAMLAAEEAYTKLLALGVNPEDARYILPEGKTTKIMMTVSYRELFNILTLRTQKAAQWEIRELAWNMYREVAKSSDDGAFMMNLWLAYFCENKEDAPAL